MRLKVYKNQYGYYRVKCPFCEESTYYKTDRIRKDPLMHLKRHMVNRAKQEALDCYLKKSEDKPAHLNYMIEHATKHAPIITTAQYSFDSDMVAVKDDTIIKE